MRRSARTAARRSAARTKCQGHTSTRFAHVRGTELSVRRRQPTARLSARHHHFADRSHARGCRGGPIRSCDAACLLGRGTRRERGTACAVEPVGPQRTARESTAAGRLFSHRFSAQKSNGSPSVRRITCLRWAITKAEGEFSPLPERKLTIRRSRFCGLARYAKLLSSAARNVALIDCFSRMSEEEKRP
jgi:hypothetical protein